MRAAVMAAFLLDPIATPGICHAPNLTADSAEAITACLRENHTDFHIFTTEEEDKGVHLHNHIVHHGMTLWALGADAETIRAQYRRNTTYQRPPPKLHNVSVVREMEDPVRFKTYLGLENHYLDFVRFFEGQIAQHGYGGVLQSHLVGDNEAAHDMLPRMYMGYVHSIMHVGLGIEFQQVSIMAEGFAQAAVHHDYWYTKFLHQAEADAARADESPLPLSACIDLCLADPAIVNCSSLWYQQQFEGDNFVMRKEMIKDGVCVNAGIELGRVAARYRVDPDNLERATAELQNTAVFASAAAQCPPHECRYDFFLIHGTNAALWHTAFLHEPSMTNKQKALLLEYTGRVVLMLFAGMGCPVPRLDYLLSQPPREPNSDWPRLFQRAMRHEDDGHMCKLVRAIAHSQESSKPFEHLPEFRLKQDMFLPAARAALDSASAKPMEGTIHYDFVRGAAWEGAWENVPIRSDLASSSGQMHKL